MGRSIKENKRPAEAFMIKQRLQPHMQTYHSVAK